MMHGQKNIKVSMFATWQGVCC